MLLWEAHLGAALPLVTGKAEPDQAGALEGSSEQA